MRIVLRHSAASLAVRKKLSIGSPVASLNLLARPKDGIFLPARMLRRCGTEQSTRTASAEAASSSTMNGASGWSDMSRNISTRNRKSQPQIFLPEMDCGNNGFLQCGMAKKPALDVPEIYLGRWLALFDMGPTEAAKVAGCSQSYISNISAGRRPNVNYLYLLRISEEMGISVNDFFSPPPNKSHVAAMKSLSPKARAAILNPDRPRQ